MHHSLYRVKSSPQTDPWCVMLRSMTDVATLNERLKTMQMKEVGRMTPRGSIVWEVGRGHCAYFLGGAYEGSREGERGEV